MDKVREANESLSFLRDKGKPFERVGRKATGLNPSIIVEAWQRGCRADQHLQFAGSSTVKISRPGYEVLIVLTNNTKFVTPLPKVPNSCFATFFCLFFLDLRSSSTIELGLRPKSMNYPDAEHRGILLIKL